MLRGLQGDGIHPRATNDRGWVVEGHQAGAWMGPQVARQPVQLPCGETAAFAAGPMGIQTDHQPVAQGHPTGCNRSVSPQTTSQQMGVVMVARHDQSRTTTGGQLIPKQAISCPGFILAQVTCQQNEVRVYALHGAQTTLELGIAVDATVVSPGVSQQVGVRQLSHCPCCGMCQWSQRLLALPNIATGSVQLSWCPCPCLEHFEATKAAQGVFPSVGPGNLSGPVPWLMP